MLSPTRGRLPQQLSWVALAAAAVFVLASGAPLCPSAGWLGVPCPGCGLTRATLTLLGGDLRGALELHPLVLVAAPAFLWLVGSALVGGVRVRDAASEAAERETESANARLGSRLGTFAAGTLIAALLVVWGLRFLGHFGGPAPVTSYAAWWQGAVEPAAADLDH